jgi:hypothetical protein
MDKETLHRALLAPETYPAGEGPVTFKETHISRIYFIGEHVYKVKKPVDFGFLDFTTLEKRRFYCHEEVRLNQRFGQDMYRGVVDIREQAGRITVDGPGRTIEYAVWMKRLPEERMLPEFLNRQDPSLPDRMAALARHLARGYQQLEIFQPGSDQPHLEVVQNNWRENFDQTTPFIGRTISSTAYDLLADYVGAFLKEHQALLRSREARGWVRDGHGDLHCQHICLLDDSFVIYDCIEFNRRFRIADVLADLAFLLMDLDLRGRPDLAATVRHHYLEIMGGRDEARLLLPFYQIYRAYVRGKVESFLSADPNADPTIRAQAASRARRYFNQALSYLCPTSMLILTCGLMGSGKTTVGKALAATLGRELLRSDELRKEIAGIPSDQRQEVPFNEGIYSPALTRQTYDLLQERCLDLLQNGRRVIADASFAGRKQRERFLASARQAGHPVWLVVVECDRDTTLQRLDRRRAEEQDASDGRGALYDRQAAAFEPVTEGPHVLRIASTQTPDAMVEETLCEILRRQAWGHDPGA